METAMKQIPVLLLIGILLTSTACTKRDKNPHDGLQDVGSGDGSHDTTNTVLYQNRDLSR